MSDQKIFDQLDITQSGRRYFLWAAQPSVPIPKLCSYSANMHIIPSTKDVAASLDDIRRGDIIILRGYLISLRGNDGWQ